MQTFWDLAPLLVTMLVLIACSAFFSSSEAALFSLRASERNRLSNGTRAQRLAYRLLSDPDRLLSAILFWNLAINIVYFALASLIGLRLQRLPHQGATWFATFSAGALLMLIFFGEMLPKTFAILRAKDFLKWFSPPLAVALRLVDPLMPTLRVINLLSRRLLWPSFAPEAYLQVDDLERAIELSTSDTQLRDQERCVLRNLMGLSDLRVDECMRPRSQLLMRRPPVHWSAVADEYMTQRSLCVTEPASDEIVAVLDLWESPHVAEDNLERFADRVAYFPWCAPVADVLQSMEVKGHQAVAVVNEMGETIGVVLRKDILDMVFTTRASRSERLLNREPVKLCGEGIWQVTGMTNLRAIEKHFQMKLPETSHVTIAGVIQECLQRLPAAGDRCVWGPLDLDVRDAPDPGPLVVLLRLVDDREDGR